MEGGHFDKYKQDFKNWILAGVLLGSGSVALITRQPFFQTRDGVLERGKIDGHRERYRR